MHCKTETLSFQTENWHTVYSRHGARSHQFQFSYVFLLVTNSYRWMDRETDGQDPHCCLLQRPLN